MVMLLLKFRIVLRILSRLESLCDGLSNVHAESERVKALNHAEVRALLRALDSVQVESAKIREDLRQFRGR